MKSQPFIFPLLGLMIGIFSVELIPNLDWYAVSAIFALSFVLLISKSGFFRFEAGLMSFFIGLGISLVLIQQFNSNSIQTEFNEKHFIQLKIREIYKPSEKFYKYKAGIQSVDSVSVSNSNCLLYWKKEHSNLFPEDEIWVSAKISETQKPLNPHQFDYAEYLKRQGIGYVIFADSTHIVSRNESSFHSVTAKFKREIYQKLLSNGYSKHSADLIGAMLLGDRNEMDENLVEQYRKTGVVHILSISGLHVMMVYSVFMVVFFPLVYLPKGKLIRILVCLCAIWFYSIFVGLQPPVLRSAMMISIYYLAIVFSRKPDIYHTLAVSAFLLLLWNPYFLFDIGFQLSFSAVFFIVWFMSVFMKVFKPKTQFSKLIVGFFATCISAQLGTFPFSAYYFHQSSLLFLAGNALMMAASYFMIVGGIFSVVLTVFNIDFPFWILLFNQLISWSNGYIGWLSGFESLIFENISLEIFEVFILIAAFVLLRFLFMELKFRYVILFLIFLLAFETHRIILKQNLLHKNEIIVFHQSRNSVIGVREGNSLNVFIKNFSDSQRVNDYLIRPYSVNEGIEKLKFHHLNDKISSSYSKSSNLIWWKNKSLMWLAENYQNQIPKADYLLVLENAKIDLDSVYPETKIIVDGSNYPNYLEENQNVWKTRKNGFYRIIP